MNKERKVVLVIIVIFFMGWMSHLWKLKKACAARGGVEVATIGGYACVQLR